MWVLLLVSSCLYMMAVTGKELCNTAGDICETLPDDLNVKALKSISDWWTELSEKKPVKCGGGSAKNEEYKLGPRVFRSYKCPDTEAFGARIGFSFKGKIVDHQFQGVGKFKLGDIDSEGHTEGTCFGRQFLTTGDRGNITTIVGNFKDGKPHGVVKMELDDGSTYIGMFKEGARHGFYRYWTAKGLAMVGYWYGGKGVGRQWRILNGDHSNIYYMPTYGKAEVDSKVLAVAKNFSLAMEGEVVHNIIVAGRYSKIDSVAVEACFLVPKWTRLEGNDFKFRGPTNELRYHRGEKEPFPFCPDEEWKEEGLIKSLKEWIFGVGSFTYDGIWQAEPSEDPMSTDALKIIDDVRQEKGNNFSCKVLGSKERIAFTVLRYHSEEESRLKGFVELYFGDSANTSNIPLLETSLRKLEGYINEDGELEGTVVFGLNDGMYATGKVKQNVMHGLVIKLGVGTVFPVAKEYGPKNYAVVSNGLGMAGQFRSGRPVGAFWIGTIGGGFLHGVLENGKFTGDEMAFVYPDLETAFFGRFEDKVMVSGRKSRVTAAKCDGGGIKVLKFAEPVGPVQFFSPGTNVSYGEGPQTQDPYEEKWVVLLPSAVPGAGQGVFAAKDMETEQLACPYSGIIYRNQEELQIYKDRYTQNVSLSEYERRWATKYSIGVGHGNAKIEIPIEFDVPGAWMPTVGQKINCDFPRRRQNVHFNHFEHPRYGHIMGVYAMKPIKAGEELFADYGYIQSEFPYDFPWYHEEKKKYLAEMKVLDDLERKEEQMKWEEQNKKEKKGKKEKKKKKKQK